MEYSPIEQKFWDEWTACTAGNEGLIKLTPQFQIGKYRVDFAHSPTKTAIELDGHATHSSPDAIAYDRQRQRYIESQGWHVIRFGGKEIYSHVGRCVDEAWTILIDRMDSKNPDPYEIADIVAMYIDRVRFRRHPGEKEYTRGYIDNEMSPGGLAHLRMQACKQHPELAAFSDDEMFVQPTEVTVKYVRDGVRARSFHGIWVGFTEKGMEKLQRTKTKEVVVRTRETPVAKVRAKKVKAKQTRKRKRR